MLTSLVLASLLTLTQVPGVTPVLAQDSARAAFPAAAGSPAITQLPLAAPTLVKTATIAAKPAAKPVAAPKKKKKKKRRSPLAPLLEGTNVEWSHAPFETGDCDLCHERSNPEDPGDIIDDVNTLCLDCHEEIGDRLANRPYVHEAIEDDCTACHNPHNAKRRMLLLRSITPLCLDCHSEIEELVKESTVKHGAIKEGKSCVNCHDPHASNVEKLLRGLASDLCLECHGADKVVDDAGVQLTDMNKLMAENPVRHPPVEAGDCAACHQPHGSENMRLLVAPYPASFYSAFDLKVYDLCLGCHDKENLTEERTSTLTGFRNGDQNLHFVHVNRDDRGRTCRACHEVHAAKQLHLVRDAVPYGKRGWMLKLNYKPTETGGQCTKTCHSTRAYDRIQPVDNKVEKK